MQPATYTIRQNPDQTFTTRKASTMKAPAPIRIPSLRSWTKEGSKYSLFRPGLGYLHIKPVSQGFALTVRPDLDGVEVGPAQYIDSRSTAEQLVTLAQQLYTTMHDQPARHNTFQ